MTLREIVARLEAMKAPSFIDGGNNGRRVAQQIEADRSALQLDIERHILKTEGTL